jgi:hypothetical protein
VAVREGARQSRRFGQGRFSHESEAEADAADARFTIVAWMLLLDAGSLEGGADGR